MSRAAASPPVTSFEVYVSKETFKFHAAHFVAYQGYREKLHGHNYKVGVRVLGSRTISSDGYVVDFGDIKSVVRSICKELNEHFLCPTLSDVMEISHQKNHYGKDTVTLECQDDSVFVFPKEDCALLPIVHATTEELSIYLWSRILEGLDAKHLIGRGIHTMEVTVTEAPGQESIFRLAVPTDPSFTSLDVKTFIREGTIEPTPCPSGPGAETDASIKPTSAPNCAGNCASCKQALSDQLMRIANAFNANKVDATNGVSVSALEAALSSEE